MDDLINKFSDVEMQETKAKGLSRSTYAVIILGALGLVGIVVLLLLIKYKILSCCANDFVCGVDCLRRLAFSKPEQQSTAVDENEPSVPGTAEIFVEMLYS